MTAVAREDDPGADPRGLIREAYRMEIEVGECRMIFLDWLLGFDETVGRAEIQALLDRYAPLHPDHPMSQVLRQALAPTEISPSPRRRRRKPRD